jgi:chitin synthase
VFATPVNKDDEVDTLIRQAFEVADASHLFTSRPDLRSTWDCVSIKYNAGVLLENEFECVLSSIILAVATLLVISILLIRFSFALIFGWCLASKLSKEPGLSEFMDESAASYIRRFF